ncbi:MAG: VOC family protein [Jatrophihabitans sp.]
MPLSTTLDHITIVTDDFEASRAVYDAVLAGLGVLPTVDYIDPEADDDDTGTVAAMGYAAADGAPLLWLVAGPLATRGGHLALAVPERSLVLSAHRAAQAVGARIVQPPRDWEERQLNYFGAQFADPAGNVIEVLCRLDP